MEKFPSTEARKQYALRLIWLGTDLLIISAGVTLTARLTGLCGCLTEFGIAIMAVSMGILALGLFGCWAVIRHKAPWFYNLQDTWWRLFHEEKEV
jgi:hypothetical protein